MRNWITRITYYAMPIALVAFIAFQTILPSLQSLGEPIVLQKSNVQSLVLNQVKEDKNVFDLKKIPDGLYFTYKADYTCTKKNSSKQLPSYFDSYKIVNGTICHLGDLCADVKNECLVRLPQGMELSKDYSQMIFDKRTYQRQFNSIPDSCVMPSCAIPPDICQFNEMAPLDAKGCPLGCGTISCQPKGENCAQLDCAAPPQNCEYDGKAKLNKNGCPIGCGNLVCDTISTQEFKCPILSCTKPPENCRYDNSGLVDKNGCKSTCGQITCDRLDPKKSTCPETPQCAEPPAGCFYVGEPAVDKNGCKIGCGGISCKKNYPEKCKQPVCEPPSEFCRYDGNSPLDFNGCLTGCGNLICNSKSIEK